MAKLVLSDDATVEAILTQIPFFCIGILAFAFATFSIFLRRSNFLSLYLYSASLLAFGSAVIDLSQVLARTRRNFDNNGVNGLINTREVGLSLSIGFKFLFYFFLVSERPQGEAPSTPPRDVQFNPLEHTHSADWRRWGYVGLALKWGLLLLVITIPVLEMVSRLTTRRFDVLYMVRNTIEIVTVALLLLKVLLNIFLSPSPTWLWYSAPGAALLINLGVSIGNQIVFSFSETTLGRFFQAIELYIVSLFLLIYSFRKEAGVSNQFVMETDSYAFDDRKDPDLKQAIDPQPVLVRPGVVVGTPPRPFDMRSSRAASWLFGRGPMRRASQGWGQGDIEQGEVGRSAVDDISPQKPPESSSKPQITSARPLTQASISSYYQMEQPLAPGLATSKSGTSSPVYGLNGIVPGPSNSARSSQQLQRASMSSFDELLRKQSELDKSIATLRLFSPQSTEPAEIPKPEPEPQRKSHTSRSVNSWAARGLESASARSEFSLSIFPEPPSRRDTIPPSTQLVPGSVNSTFRSNFSIEQGVTTRLGSNGTQYDVTSFIANPEVPLTSLLTSQDEQDPSKETALVGSALASVTTPQPMAPATASSGVLTAIQARRLSSAPAVSSPLANPFHPRNPLTIPAGPRGPVRPRGASVPTARRVNPMNISGPKLQVSDGRGDQAPGAFERPRPPPLVLSQDQTVS